MSFKSSKLRLVNLHHRIKEASVQDVLEEELFQLLDTQPDMNTITAYANNLLIDIQGKTICKSKKPKEGNRAIEVLRTWWSDKISLICASRTAS